MEYIRNIYGISIDIYDIKESETQAPPSAAAALGLCFWLFCIINVYDVKESETQTHWGAAEGGACVSDYFTS